MKIQALQVGISLETNVGQETRPEVCAVFRAVNRSWDRGMLSQVAAIENLRAPVPHTSVFKALTAGPLMRKYGDRRGWF